MAAAGGSARIETRFRYNPDVNSLPAMVPAVVPLLLMLVLLPLQMLSGGTTPRESMSEVVQFLMLGAPNTHFVMLAQAILYRGAGLAIVWPRFAALVLIGAILFGLSLNHFRKTLASMV